MTAQAAERKLHMEIPWERTTNSGLPAASAPLGDKASLVCRIGHSLQAAGTGSWRIRCAMNTVAEALGIVCTADVGLLTITTTCFDEETHATHSLALKTSGVNTDRLAAYEQFVREIPALVETETVEELHARMDAIDAKKGNYRPLVVGLAAAFACAAFTFLLGGGPVEMLCAFLGAGSGNYVRRKLTDRKLAMMVCVVVSVALSCLVYVASVKLLEAGFDIPATHHAGYICAMLFVIPGFPLITGGIDLAKLDMRSGIERLTYAFLTILVATMVGWCAAYLLHFMPDDFEALSLSAPVLVALHLVMSFIGVFGFSMMFNSPLKMCAVAAFSGMIANTLRLELVHFGGLPIGFAAFLGALTAGLIASFVNREEGIPRIAMTVPSIVIMVPGLYMYRGVYHLVETNLGEGTMWLVEAFLIVIALPMGLVAARLLTDSDFRHIN